MGYVDEFLVTARDYLSHGSVQASPWSCTPRRSNHLVSLHGGPKETVLYVKESNTDPAFWGLTKNQIERLHEHDVRWFVVLLHRSSSSGYILTGGQIDARISNGVFTLSGDGDYKVNQGVLEDGQCFASVADAFGRIL
jgi:hypothetical protein